MELDVRFDSEDPPSGSVRRRARGDEAGPDAEADVRVTFTGWLGLLAALNEVIQAAE